jgi:hypothetical protein
MTKHSIIFAMVMIGLAACSPNKQQASRPGKAAAAKSADTGQTPHPVGPVVDEDLFHGWKCGDGDCSLHQAGYAWAAQHKIVNPQDCQEKSETGKSESFIEGCWAYTGAEGPFGQKEVFQDED